MKIACRIARPTRRVLLALGVGAAVALAAGPVSSGLAADAPAVVVKMRDMPPSFDPPVVTINAGDTVKWENAGDSVHHATDDHEMAIKSDDVKTPTGALVFDSGFMRPGETFTHTFTTPGVYKYVCVAHEASGMIGEVIVKPRNG
jgi:plastocyanin